MSAASTELDGAAGPSTLAVVLVLVVSPPTFANAPEIGRITPRAIAPDTTTEVLLEGRHLGSPLALWTGFPAEVTFADERGDGTRLRCSIRPAPGAHVGVHPLRLVTRSGISDLELVLIDDLASTAETGGEGDAAPQPLDAPVAVDGNCEELHTDRFTLEGVAGERLTVEVVAARLGSLLDPVLTIHDPDGRELAHSNDAPGLGADARLSFSLPSSGRCLIGVRDAIHGGGDRHFYRLRIGDFPEVTTPFPLGARRGATTSLAFAGAGAQETIAPLELSIARDAPRGITAVGARSRGGSASGLATVVADDLDELLEAEPNDTWSAAMPIGHPAAISGRFDAPGDADVYRLAARRGDRLRLAARTRSVGSPAHVALKLIDAGGRTIARSDLDAADEGVISHTFERDGEHALVVEELTGSGGDGHTYRVEIGRATLAVELTAAADTVFVEGGTELAVVVQCDREKFKGDVRLEIEGLGEEVTLEDAVIPSKEKETKLRARLESLGDGHPLRVIRIVGIVTSGPENNRTEHRIPVSTRPILGKRFPRMEHFPGDVEESITVFFAEMRRTGRF